MTLIVSVRTMDGIVLAGDSLATFMATPDISITCPNCSTQISASTSSVFIPSTTLPYAQKIMPFKKCAVGAYGVGQFTNKTVYLVIRQFERTYQPNSKATTRDLAEAVGNHLHGLMMQDIAALQQVSPGFVLQPDLYPAGLQVVGYDGEIPTAHWVQIGNDVKITSEQGLNWFCTGALDVVQKFDELHQADQHARPLITGFTLQDAIEYAEFLIRTTATHQRFSNRAPSVGGEIDVLVVTPLDGVKWIKQKRLYSTIEDR